MTGPIAIAMSDAIRNIPVNGARWEAIPDYGRGTAAVALDGQAADVRYVFTPQTRESETFLGKAFYENAKNNARTMHFSVTVDKAGRHVLKLISPP